MLADSDTVYSMRFQLNKTDVRQLLVYHLIVLRLSVCVLELVDLHMMRCRSVIAWRKHPVLMRNNGNLAVSSRRNFR